MRSTDRYLMLIIACAVLLGITAASVRAAGPMVVGVAQSSGRLEVDRASADHTANLLNGSILRSLETPVRVRWNAGGLATLAAASEARILPGHLELHSGTALVPATVKLNVTGPGWAIVPTASSAQALAEWRGNRLQVAAIGGDVRVLDPHGRLIARVSDGRVLALEPAPENARLAIQGALLERSGSFQITDEISQVTYRLRGEGLASVNGRRVSVEGSLTDAGEDVVQVARLAVLPEEETPAKSKSTSKQKTSRAGTTLSRGAKIGIGTGIAAGVGLGVALPLAVLSR